MGLPFSIKNDKSCGGSQSKPNESFLPDRQLGFQYFFFKKNRQNKRSKMIVDIGETN